MPPLLAIPAEPAGLETVERPCGPGKNHDSEPIETHFLENVVGRRPGVAGRLRLSKL